MKSNNILKNPYQMIVGYKYKIYHPIYDDYNEGLEQTFENLGSFE